MIYKILSFLAALSICFAIQAQQKKPPITKAVTTKASEKLEENKIKQFEPSEEDKRETIEWVTNKLNTFSIPLKEDENLKFWNDDDDDSRCRAIFSDTAGKANYRIDTVLWSIIIEWSSLLKGEARYLYSNKWNYRNRQAEFYNTVSIPINNIKEISRKTHFTGGYEYMHIFKYEQSMDFDKMFQELNSFCTLRKYNRVDGINTRSSYHYLVFKTDLQLITSKINGKPETKEWGIEMPFNFNEDYDLVNRIEKAVTHLKKYYTKKRPQEKF